MPRKSLLVAAGALALFIAAPRARAAYIVNVVQSGPNVFASGSGTVSITGLPIINSGTTFGFVQPHQGAIGLGSGIFTYYGVANSNVMGVGGFQSADSFTGGIIGTGGPPSSGVPFPSTFMGGDPGPSTATWNNKTIAGLGLIEGTYTWTWGSASDQKFIVNVGTQVPESTSVALTGCGIGFLSLVMWKRRRAAGRPPQVN